MELRRALRCCQPPELETKAYQVRIRYQGVYTDEVQSSSSPAQEPAVVVAGENIT